MYKIKNDKFQKSRGGTSCILDVRCDHCAGHVCYYQKKRPRLTQAYVICRMINLQPTGESLLCAGCQRLLGVRVIWQKEDRPAYRLFAGAVTKKIISRDQLSRSNLE